MLVREYVSQLLTFELKSRKGEANYTDIRDFSFRNREL